MPPVEIAARDDELEQVLHVVVAAALERGQHGLHHLGGRQVRRGAKLCTGVYGGGINIDSVSVRPDRSSAHEGGGETGRGSQRQR